MENKKQFLIALAVVVIMGFAGFYTIFYMHLDVEKQQADEVQLEETQDRLEMLLKDFLSQVSRAASDYRKERRIVVEASTPMNLSKPEYVQQNYDLVRTLIPSLKKRKDVLMNIFAVTEDRINEFQRDLPPETRRDITIQWNDLKTKQVGLYTHYFGLDEQILAVYEELMAFYNDRRESFTVDTAQNMIAFKDPEDAAKEKEIRDRMDALYAEQKKVLAD